MLRCQRLEGDQLGASILTPEQFESLVEDLPLQQGLQLDREYRALERQFAFGPVGIEGEEEELLEEDDIEVVSSEEGGHAPSTIPRSLSGSGIEDITPPGPPPSPITMPGAGVALRV